MAGENISHAELRDDEPSATRKLIGARLKALREAHGLSLREAAARASLSRSFLATVERGDSEIAVTRLIRLASVYEAGISDLLDGSPTSQVEFVPAAETLDFPTNMDSVSISYLASASWGVQPFLVELKPEARFEDLSHPGDEFIHCLDGNPTIVAAGESHEMSPGDTIVIPSEATHSYLNPMRNEARLIGAVTREDPSST